MRSASERSNKLKTEKHAFDILIWKLLLTFAKAILLKVVEVVTCLHWDEERVRDDKIETANVDNSYKFYCKGKETELVWYLGKGRVKSKEGLEKNGNIGIFICSWEESGKEERLSVQQREEAGDW